MLKKIKYSVMGLLVLLLTVLSVLTYANTSWSNQEITVSSHYIEPTSHYIEPTESIAFAIDPSIYIFNSHPLEMIGSSFYDLSVGEASIIDLSHMLADHLALHGISPLVEQRRVDQMLSENNWRYHMSYRAARSLLLDAINHYSTLELFVDLHRDGVAREYATAEIDGIFYARVLFVIGTDNPVGYNENYEVARQLHNLLEERKPGISRGIFFSGGSGRDGIYNQDISPMVQLIEVGTVESTVYEVSRTVEILAEVLAEYIY